jgi:integration host factor subunit beta
MTKFELITALTKRSELEPLDVERVVRCMIDAMVNELASGGRVEVRGFGAFSLRRYGARIGRNPRTGTSVSVPARYSVRFKAGLELRQRVDESTQQYKIND